MHDDSFEPTQMLSALVHKQMVVAQQRAQLRTRIAKLHETDHVLRSRYIALENAIHEARIGIRGAVLPTSARPSPKNLGFLRSWMALREAIANSYDPCGLPHHKVVQVISRAVPGIREATIRSHLHRLRKRGFVEKVSNNWRLTAKGAHDVDSEVDLDRDNETSKG
jgi:hypothetical protein